MFTPIPVQFLKAHCFLWTFFLRFSVFFSITCLSKRTVRNHLNQFWHLHIFQDLWQKAQYIPIIGNVYLQREINFFRKCPNLWHIIWDWVLNSLLGILMMKYGEKFEIFFRKGAQILAFSKRNFFFRSPFTSSRFIQLETFKRKSSIFRTLT